MEKEIEMLYDNWEKLKEGACKNEQALQKEIERLGGMLRERVAEVKDMKADEYQTKMLYEGQLN